MLSAVPKGPSYSRSAALPSNLAIADPEPGGFPPVFTAICHIQGRGRSGTGFFVGERANVVTARHVVCEQTGADSTSNSQEKSPIFVSWVCTGKHFLFKGEAELVRDDPRTDLALLRLKNPEEFPRPLSLDSVTSLSSVQAMPGDWVYFDAFRFDGLEKFECRRVLTRVQRSDVYRIHELYQRLLTLDEKSWPGSSGAPVFSAAGKVVGVITAGRKDTEEALVRDIWWIWPLFDGISGNSTRTDATILHFPPEPPRFAPYCDPYPEPWGVWLRRVGVNISRLLKRGVGSARGALAHAKRGLSS